MGIAPGECRNIHNGASFPNEAGFTRSSRLWVAIMPTPNTAIQRTGRRTISAIQTMLQPKIQMTPAAPHGTNAQAKPTTVNSSTTSHMPRVKKNQETCCTDFPREVARYAPVPARKENRRAVESEETRKKQSPIGVCHINRVE